MKVCFLLIGDGRDEVHERSKVSVQEMLPKPDALVVVDDSDHSRGFAGAIAEGWARVLQTGADWVFHVELDFLFTEPVELRQMVWVLNRHPELAQLSLKRQAWNEREKAAGGIIEADPDDFTEVTEYGYVWTEHRRYWTTNPSLYSARFCEMGWPQESESEGRFTHQLLDADPNLRFGIWGSKFAPPKVEHVGVRAGVGY